MKQIYRLLPVLIFISVRMTGIAVAQEDSTKLNQSVEVMKAYHPSISKANKVNLMPSIEDTARFSPEFTYSIDSYPVTSGFSASPIKAADVNKRLYNQPGIGYLKLGAGTNSTPYGEFFLNLPESKTAVFGLYIRHLSSGGKIRLREDDLVEAPFSHNNAAIFGAVSLGNTVLTTNLSYDRDGMNYYGYPVALPSNIGLLPVVHYGLKQAYQNGNVNIALKSIEGMKSDLKFAGGFRLGYFDARTGQKETSAGVFGKIDYNFGQVNGLLDLSYDHFATDSISLATQILPGSKSDDWLRVAPSVRLEGDSWSLRGGVNFVSVSDKEGEKVSKLYPDFEFNFIPVKGILTLFAGFKGDLRNNNYGAIALDNYWADPRHNVRNTDLSYIISGGLRGKISREMSYKLGLKYSQAKDLYFYVQHSFADPSSSKMPAPVIYNNSFGVTYDNAAITNFSAEFSYVSGSDLSVVLRGNYYNYSLDELPFAPHMPDLDLNASVGVKIMERVSGFADLGMTGKRKTMTYPMVGFVNNSANMAINQVFNIDPSIQLNLGATYEMTDNFKLFGRVDNLLNRQNEQWLGYASQGLRVLAGVAFSF